MSFKGIKEMLDGGGWDECSTKDVDQCLLFCLHP